MDGPQKEKGSYGKRNCLFSCHLPMPADTGWQTLMPPATAMTAMAPTESYRNGECNQ